MAEVDAWIGLGSNLNDPVQQVKTALAELGGLVDCSLCAVSSLYRSPPMGPADQPDYVNAVARLRTRLPAAALLDALQGIEARHGRRRGRRWGERTLDLDLLVYGREVIDTRRLTVPHPGIAERNFVLYPLAELAPGLVIPGVGAVADLLKRCPDKGLSRIEV
ncbi:MAG: 2-amino-4-hydroxy-6-hydroxymethyldihydropteridine diphosphokinase [Gammaproteobacteria bacterium]